MDKREATARLLQAQGIAATKISGMYKTGADISVPLLGTDRAVAVKRRAVSFAQLDDMAGGRQALTAHFVAQRADRREPLVIVCSFVNVCSFVKAVRQEPLVVVCTSLAAEIAKRTI